MSNIAIRQVLETKLATIEPKLPTAWPNTEFSAPEGQPYQEAYLLWAKPENPTMGDNHYRQRGVFQITLRYPQGIGAADADLRGELLRSEYHRGLSLTRNGVKTVIDETPEVSEGRNVGERYVVIVRIRFYADVF